MEALELGTKFANLGGLALFAWYVLGELREQRRENRRRQSATDDALVKLGQLLVSVYERVSELVDRGAPRSSPPPLPERSARHVAPPFGVEVTREELPSRRKRTVSDDPDDGDE